ncbi:MAG: hypothetical protein RL540_1465 [Actinomycetota bacterium]
MQQNRFEIVCTEELMSKIEDHCFSSTKTEVGGFLVGKIEDGKSIVTHVLKAKHTANTQSQLTFTNKTWEAALAEMGEIGPDAALIGWFHSHPNFGVFLSDYDKFIQNEFFKLDGMITIVVDPINGKRGWFISLDKEVRPYAPEEDTKREKLKKKEDEDKPDAGIQVKERASTQGVSLSKVVAIAAAFSMLSFVGGFATSGTRGASLDQIGELEAQVTQLKFQVENLLLGGSEEEAVTEPEVVVTSGAKPSSTSGTQKVPQSTNKKTPNTPAKSTVGSSCPKAGDLTNGGKLICKKVGEKLVWAVRVIPANDKKGKESGNTGTSQGTSSGGSNNSGTSSSDGSTSSGGSKPTNDSDNPSDTNQDTKSTDENKDK